MMTRKRITILCGAGLVLLVGGFYGYRTWALHSGASLIQQGTPSFARGKKRLLLAHKLGSDRAAYRLGMALWDGTGCPKDSKEAVRWLTLAADSGDIDAMATLGMAFRTGTGIDEDQKKGQEYIKKAAAGRQPKAMAMLAEDLLAGSHGETATPQEAFKLAKEAATQNDPTAMLLFGKIMISNAAPEFALVKGSQGTPQEGFKWMEKAADAGNTEACYILGAAYLAMSDMPDGQTMGRLGKLWHPAHFANVAFLNPFGNYLPRDVKKAESYLMKAVSTFPQGPGELLFRKLYQDKAINPNPDPTRALQVLEQLIAYGDSWAPGRLGLAYMDGETELAVAKSPEKAANLLKIGEARGDQTSARVLKIFRDSETRANDPLKVERLGIYAPDGFPRIQGLVRNTSGVPHNARVAIDLVQPNGTLIENFSKTFFGLLPGQTASIDIAIAPYHRNAQVKVRSVEWQ